MQTVSFHKFWPGGNTTALVEESVSHRNQAGVAHAIMDAHSDVEQVGFIGQDAPRPAHLALRMMGGEFCGNAARCSGFLYALRHKCTSCVIEIAGMPRLIAVEVTSETAAIMVPGDFFVSLKRIPEGVLVELMGISHIVLADPAFLSMKEEICARYRGNLPALGIVAQRGSDAALAIEPFVWVRETDTFIAESGCGSGSIAAACLRHAEHLSERRFSVLQPSGETYEVLLLPGEEGIASFRLSGKIAYLGQGAVSLDCLEGERSKNFLPISSPYGVVSV